MPLPHEILIQLEDALNAAEHTRACITKNLVNGLECMCGLDKLRFTFMDYREALRRENQTF